VTEVIVGGLATDYCLMATSIAARGAGLVTDVMRDCVRPVNLHPKDGIRALGAMRKAGVNITTSTEVLKRFGRRAAL
jgi:nicotinamidase/pyrazinamidase